VLKRPAVHRVARGVATQVFQVKMVEIQHSEHSLQMVVVLVEVGAQKAQVVQRQAKVVVLVVVNQDIPILQLEQEINHNAQAILELMVLETQAAVLAATLVAVVVVLEQLDSQAQTLLVVVVLEEHTQSLVRQYHMLLVVVVAHRVTLMVKMGLDNQIMGLMDSQQQITVVAVALVALVVVQKPLVVELLASLS
tara:strand:- start:98 stop:679 length:582 start_codon:yes stop_codon:yes gene_type:complete